MDELLDSAPCGFLSFADDGKILLANTTLLNWLGYTRNELTGQYIDLILTAGGRMFYQAYLFPLIKLHGRAEEIYFTLRTKRGNELAILANAVRRERDGTLANDCILMPMRQRRRYEEEILQAKKAAEAASEAKARFLSMMSHDLRTPLQAISASAYLLAEGVHGPTTELQKQDVHRIQRASHELMRLITDILNFAQLDAGRVSVRIEDVPVPVALERAEALVLVRMQEAGLEYKREGDAAELMVRADPDRLQQILLNLLTNAIKFTPRGGCISVAAESSDSRALLHVHDTGVGIPADQLEQIFEPFVQVEHQQVNAPQHGVGLGLAISRELARAMGGDVVASSVVGEGSTFTVVLPASAGSPAGG